ncbi:MAG TPA: amidohydrolase family protein [Acidimicrobiia bacterium]
MDAAEIRARIDHPVIDADGHLIEYLPLLRDFLVEEAGETVAARFDDTLASSARTRALSSGDRRRLGISRTGWWGVPSANTLDRATAMLPKLLYDRLDELGIDVAILYPTAGLMAMALDDDELRTALARACNRYAAECYGELSDRLLPVAVVPNYTPGEALAELEHAVVELGLRPVLFGGLVLRPAPGHDGDRAARWVDGLGLDSEHDYDPVWARCVELGVSPTFHSTGIGFGSRTSPMNYVANHIGNFAAGSEAVCRSLLFGGAMRRFPQLRFAFLEGGIAWACTLFSDVLGHWEKRNAAALQHYDPAALDRPQLDELVRRYGSDAFAARLDALGPTLGFLSDPDEDRATLDEFAASGVTSRDDLRAIFTEQCFFGCEADDPMNALAFDAARVPMAGRLQAMFASDIGHWDVPDFRSVLGEAWQLVQDGRIDETAFRAFTFEHVAALFTGTRPDFFAGTAVEDAVAALPIG